MYSHKFALKNIFAIYTITSSELVHERVCSQVLDLCKQFCFLQFFKALQAVCDELSEAPLCIAPGHVARCTWHCMLNVSGTLMSRCRCCLVNCLVVSRKPSAAWLIGLAAIAHLASYCNSNWGLSAFRGYENRSFFLDAMSCRSAWMHGRARSLSVLC